jgi:adenosylhomocysteinase
VHRASTLEFEPTLTLDDGADLIFTVHRKHRTSPTASSAAPRRRPPACIACCAWPADGKLRYPVIAVNDAETKWDFDNVYGTGQSSIDGILRATRCSSPARTSSSPASATAAAASRCARAAWARTSSSPR